jgi:hypothetical protein
MSAPMIKNSKKKSQKGRLLMMVSKQMLNIARKKKAVRSIKLMKQRAVYYGFDS